MNLTAYDAVLANVHALYESQSTDGAEKLPAAQPDPKSDSVVDPEIEELKAMRVSLADLQTRIEISKGDLVAALRQELFSELAAKQRLLVKLLGGARLEVARSYDAARQGTN